MNPAPSADELALLERALCAARDTRFLEISRGAYRRAGAFFTAAFGTDATFILVGDQRTMAACGQELGRNFADSSLAGEPPFIFGDDVHAEISHAERLLATLAATRAIPVAVGSGTINDLTKLAAHRTGRPYMAVATAASMDGYTAYGASITANGSKQTFDCPAPWGVLADLDVIGRAPRWLNASGYADLLAKGVAGADWILADAAGEEAIDPGVWSTVQEFLPRWVDAPSEIARGEPKSLHRLVLGLMMSGFAMQAAQSSRPASGAEHQFSHLWDMQGHTHDGEAPSHGFKVGIGTLASLNLYDFLLRLDLAQLDVERAVARHPTPEQTEARIRETLGTGELAEMALIEARAKAIAPDALRAQLLRLRDGWPDLVARLNCHLHPYLDAREKLKAAGCPHEPEQIGIPRERLRRSYEQAYFIRRRFTVLDLAMRLGVFEDAMASLFDSGGIWETAEGRS